MDCLIYDDFIETKKLKARYVDQGLKYGWKSNNALKGDHGHWNNLIMSASKWFKYDQTKLPYAQKHPLLLEAWDKIKAEIGDRALMRCYVNGYTYGTDAYSHVDDVHMMKYTGKMCSETAIIYLNQEWNIDWAGETVIFNEAKDDVELSVLPKKNRLFVFDSTLLHAARPMSRLCPTLRVVLVFKTGDLELNDPVIGYLLEKTSGIKHSKRTFFEHLYGVLLRLEKMGCDKDTCAAGLYHSIYDTEYFTAGINPSREEIKDLIGEKAENLVHLFCNLKNRTQKIIDGVGDDELNKALRQIELANLEDQGCRDDRVRRLRELLV